METPRTGYGVVSSLEEVEGTLDWCEAMDSWKLSLLARSGLS